MIYNFSDITNNMSSATSTIIAFDQTLLNGMLGLVICLIVFIFTFLGFVSRSEDVGKSLLASSWICVLVGVILRIVGLMNDYVLLAIAIIAAGLFAITRSR